MQDPGLGPGPEKERRRESNEVCTRSVAQRIVSFQGSMVIGRKDVNIRGSGRKVYGNSLFQFCNFSSLKLFQNKSLKKKQNRETSPAAAAVKDPNLLRTASLPSASLGTYPFKRGSWLLECISPAPGSGPGTGTEREMAPPLEGANTVRGAEGTYPENRSAFLTEHQKPGTSCFPGADMFGRIKNTCTNSPPTDTSLQ